MVQKNNASSKTIKKTIMTLGKGLRFNLPKQQKIEKKYKMENKRPFQNLWNAPKINIK